jgi:hypothetical protein
LPEREVWPQVGERERLARQRVNGVALQVLHDGSALISMPILCDNGIVHNLERDVVYQVFRDLLWNVSWRREKLLAMHPFLQAVRMGYGKRVSKLLHFEPRRLLDRI